jgi:hypothetical protein
MVVELHGQVSENIGGAKYPEVLGMSCSNDPRVNNLFTCMLYVGCEFHIASSLRFQLRTFTLILNRKLEIIFQSIHILL